MFGPTVAQLSLAAGFVTQEQFNFYRSLPVAPDADDVPNDKDDFIKQILVAQTNAFGYDPIGLQNSRIDATLLQGDYLSTHTYGWTQVDIDSHAQKLTITTYGIPSYSEADPLTNPAAVTSLTPQVVSQFEVNPVLPSDCKQTIDIAAGHDNKPLVGDADVFALTPDSRSQTILNFENGIDRIKLRNGLTFDQLTIAQGAGVYSADTFIGVKGTNLLLASLTGVQSSSVTQADFASAA